MIVLGLILVLVGAFTKITMLYYIGGVLLIIGAVLLVLGLVGRPVGGRTWY